MQLRLSRRFRAVPHVIGLMMAVAAFVSQLALGSMVLPESAVAAPRSAIAAVAVLCAGAPVHRPHPAPAPHRAADPAMCPLSVALALPAVLPMTTPVLPVPRLRSLFALAWARAPPMRMDAAATAHRPRGPPVLS